MRFIAQLVYAGITLATTSYALADPLAQAPWLPDRGDGTYQNPVLAADYSDPDVIRVGKDFYLVSSSFTNVPGLPILHSRDLVNWTIIAHALKRQPPNAHHSIPRRGGGVWAPAIRHHAGKFYIYYPDPDFGIYVVTASDPRGPWSEPLLIDRSRGVIDPCPFWDDDGTAWLVVAWARSRAGFNNVITLKRMAPDGLSVLDQGRVIIDGQRLPKAKTSNGLMSWEPLEGPKVYKRAGWYYLFAPAGGVKPGWQAVFRSRTIDGKYEHRVVLDQGASAINGPHQGAWVTTASGEDWFLHFQDTDSYGRRVHLQPLTWKRDWPVIGLDADGDGRGEPVQIFRKPQVSATQLHAVPQMNDDFNGELSLAWQWHSNPQEDWLSLSAAPGHLRLKSVPTTGNPYETGSLLTQKFPAPAFSVTTKLGFAPVRVGEEAGLVVVGTSSSWIGLRNTAAGLRLVQMEWRDGQPREIASTEVASGELFLRATAHPISVAVPTPTKAHWPSELRSTHALVRFFYSTDGERFNALSEATFQTDPGRWVGTTFGLFSSAPAGTPAYVATSVGYADFDFVSVTR